MCVLVICGKQQEVRKKNSYLLMLCYVDAVLW